MKFCFLISFGLIFLLVSALFSKKLSLYLFCPILKTREQIFILLRYLLKLLLSLIKEISSSIIFNASTFLLKNYQKNNLFYKLPKFVDFINLFFIIFNKTKPDFKRAILPSIIKCSQIISKILY